jgi:hypothetical protein
LNYGRPVVQGGDEQRPQGRPWAFLLLLLPIASIVYPPLYDRRHPTLAGIPFFVWYQLAAVVFGGVVTGVVYVLRGTERSLSR